MIKKLLLAFLMLSSQAFAYSGEEISTILQSEWREFRSYVDTLEADGDIGGYMDYKEYGDMTLLWRTSNDNADNEVIRFYMDRTGINSFSVTYHKSSSIINGRTVLRRFVGPEPTGWINHTIDFQTGEYLGRQGYFPQDLSSNELSLINDWGIQLIGNN